MFCYIAVYLAHSSLNIFFFFFSSQMEFPFVDDSFPPCNKSLTFNGTACPKVHRWLRPEDIGGPSTLWKVFSNPQPSDIIQGSLGDCWWVIVSFFVWLCGNVKLYWWMIGKKKTKTLFLLSKKKPFMRLESRQCLALVLLCHSISEPSARNLFIFIGLVLFIEPFLCISY